MACAPSHLDTPNVGGRPRNFDLDILAQELIDWSEKHDSINLNKFCALHNPKIPPQKISTWAKEHSGFREAYEIAKASLGFRREEWLNSDQMHVKAYDLNATTYDFFLKEEKMDMQKYESSLKKDEQIAVSDSELHKFSALRDQLNKLQAKSSACKMDDISIKAETKS